MGSERALGGALSACKLQRAQAQQHLVVSSSCSLECASHLFSLGAAGKRVLLPVLRALGRRAAVAQSALPAVLPVEEWPLVGR